MGDREKAIDRAIELIGEQAGSIEARSALYYSEPWGFESEHSFVNAVVRIGTSLSPHKLLRVTQRIERQMGKNAIHATDRPSPKSQSSITTYHDRPIDIDILLYDDITVDTPRLKIPHPLMQQRPFVMEPLQEVKR